MMGFLSIFGSSLCSNENGKVPKERERERDYALKRKERHGHNRLGVVGFVCDVM